MSDQSDKLIRQIYRRYFNLCFQRGIRPVSLTKFRDDIDRRIKRYIATELARAIQEQQSDKDMYIATPALDVPEETIEKFGFKFLLCGECGKEVAVDPKMLKHATEAEKIICINCLPAAAGVTMEEITKIVLRTEHVE